MTRIYTYILLPLSLLILSCSSKESDSEEKKDKETQENRIVLTRAQFEQGDFALGKPDTLEFSERFRVTGMIDVPPENRASVSTYFEGYVSKTTLLIGDTVKKGDLLVTLENPEFINLQRDYLQKSSQLEFLEAEFIRKTNLLEDQVISEKVFQKAKSDYLAMKADLAGLKKTLEMMNVSLARVEQGDFTTELNIYAPISGKISKLNISQGMFVQKSFSIMEILDTDHIHLELDVFEKDILKINKKQPLTFQLPEQNGEIYNAYVKLIGAEISQDRTVKVHAHPVDENQNFAVGMFVEAFFNYQSETELALPSSAFVEQNDKYHVLELVKETDKELVFEPVKVDTDDPQEDFKPILNPKGIPKNARFLTRGAFDIVTKGGGSH